VSAEVFPRTGTASLWQLNPTGGADHAHGSRLVVGPGNESLSLKEEKVVHDAFTGPGIQAGCEVSKRRREAVYPPVAANGGHHLKLASGGLLHAAPLSGAPLAATIHRDSATPYASLI
jgi:hypothetical protein